MYPMSQALVFLTVEPKTRGVLPMYPMSQALVFLTVEPKTRGCCLCILCHKHLFSSLWGQRQEGAAYVSYVTSTCFPHCRAKDKRVLPMYPMSQALVFLTLEPKTRRVLPMYPMSQALVFLTVEPKTRGCCLCILCHKHLFSSLWGQRQEGAAYVSYVTSTCFPHCRAKDKRVLPMYPMSQALVFLTLEPKTRRVLPMYPTSQALVFLTVEPKTRGVLPMYPTSLAHVFLTVEPKTRRVLPMYPM